MSNIFAVTSGKGGVGKSTFSVGLALAFAKMGKKVVLIDMDEGLRCLDIMLDAEREIVFDLADALESGEEDKAIYKIARYENVFLVPAPNKTGSITPENLSLFAEKLSRKFDVLIFDFPAGIDVPLYSALPEKTVFFTVAVPDAISIRDASSVNMALSSSGMTTRLIINKFDIKKMRKGIYHNIDDMIDLSGIRLIGIVPESKELAFFSLKHKLKMRGNTAKAFLRIANRAQGNRVALPKFKKI